MLSEARKQSAEASDLNFDENGIAIYLAAKLAELPDGSFRCCITSPPYWGLRDYDHPDQIGAEPKLDDYIQNLVRVYRVIVGKEGVGLTLQEEQPALWRSSRALSFVV